MIDRTDRATITTRNIPEGTQIFFSLEEALEFARDEDTIRYNADDGPFWQVIKPNQFN